METQYKIIGGDGREYGPANLEELQGWIRDGRVAGSTSVWCSDSAAWAHAETYGELAFELRPSAAAMPAVEALTEAVPVGFWARLAAYLIDWVILSIVFMVIWNGVLAVTGWENIALPQPDANMDLNAMIKMFADYFQKMMPLLLWQFFLGKLVQASYEVSFNGKWGATLGKMAIGARIVRLDGSPIGYGLAMLRWLAARVSDVIFCIGYLFIAFRKDKRALHDLMVGTKVVFKR